MPDEEKDGPAGEEPSARTRDWDTPCTGAADLLVEIDAGRVEVHLEDVSPSDGEDHQDRRDRDDASAEPGRRVQVRLGHDQAGTPPWTQGVSGVLGWLGAQLGSGDDVLADPEGAAVDAAEISWSAPDRRLVVRSSRALPLRLVPLVVTVHAPASSVVSVRSGTAAVAVTGRAGRALLRSGSGRVTVETVAGEAELASGSGDVAVGEALGRLRVRSGSGAVDARSVAGPSVVTTGSGTVRLGTVTGDTQVRSGSGDVVVADATRGEMDLATGAGELRVGVHAGVWAEVDLRSGPGRARSDLPVADSPPGEPASLRVRGRASAGPAVLTRAG